MKKLIKPPYKSDNGMWYTESLFHERSTGTARPIEPVFSLYDDRPGLINCRTTFVALKDPTGRKWALTYLGDWSHWVRLMRCSWFKEAYDQWVSELNLQLKSEAMSKIMEIMGGDNGAQALAAAKFIASEEYKKAGRGRPSKTEVDGELKRAVKALEQEDEDLERMGLRLIQGGKGAN